MAELLPGLDAALEAINQGDVEPTVALLDEAVEWRARPQGHLWWKHMPRCSGPDEARTNLEAQAAKGARAGPRRFQLEQVEQVGRRLVIAGRWTAQGGSRPETRRFFQVLTVHDCKIIDIQGCNSRRAALAYARRAESA
jgi:ketosteroid isomerase-like protein